jgi:hypothetical protein
MIVFRFFIIAFNVAIVAFLIYKMVMMVISAEETSKKVVFIVGATILLLAPLGIFFRFFALTPQYFIVYPIAIIFFMYFTKQLSR